MLKDSSPLALVQTACPPGLGSFVEHELWVNGRLLDEHRTEVEAFLREFKFMSRGMRKKAT